MATTTLAARPAPRPAPWVTALALIGRAVGSNWESWRDHLGYLDYVVVALVVIGIVYLLVRRRRDRDQGGGAVELEPR